MTPSGLVPRSNTTRALAYSGALLLAGLLVWTGDAWAGAEGRKATTGAVELTIPVGPRGTALGATVIGDIDGVEAMYWNPAGLGGIEGTEALFSHTDYFAGMKVNYGAVVTRWPGFGTLGVAAKVLSIGDLFETTEDAPEGTGKIFSPTFSVLGLTYARQFTDRVRFGATVNYVSERVLDVSAEGVAFDLGVQYMPGWKGFGFGLVMKNFGPAMEFTGSGFQQDFRRPDADPTAGTRSFLSSSASFDLPSYFVLAATYDVTSSADHRLATKASFESNNFVGDVLRGGLEWTYRDTFALRGSYFGSFASVTDPLSGETSGGFESGDDLYSGLSLGAGVGMNVGGSHLVFDLAWRAVRDYFDDTFEFGLKAAL